MLYQIHLYLLCAFIGAIFAICLDKYLSWRKGKSIPGYKLIKSIENRKDSWLSEIPLITVDKKFTLTAKIGKGEQQ